MRTDRIAKSEQCLGGILDILAAFLVFLAADRLVFPRVLVAYPLVALLLLLVLRVLDAYHGLYSYRAQQKRQPLVLAVGLFLSGAALFAALRLAARRPRAYVLAVLATLAACYPLLLLCRLLLLRRRAIRAPQAPGETPREERLLFAGNEVIDLAEAQSPDLDRLRRRPADRILKLIFDRAASLAGLILCVPVFLVIAAAIKLDSRGPVFYRQERYTIHKKRFHIIKFRTMVPDAEKDGVQLATEYDARVTRVGRFLRRFRLDELPQLLNILRGEMSFVGPRPERPVYADQYSRTVPNYDLRYLFKAGLTGFAQVYGTYDTKAADKIIFDCLYINRFSIWLDLKLMVQTALVVCLKEMSAGVKEEDARVVSQESPAVPAAEGQGAEP